MELVTVLRVLARRRLLLVLGMLAAGCLAGGAFVLGLFAQAERRAGEGFTKIQIDTPSSLYVDLGASNATIGIQTRLLANAMPSSSFVADLARAAGISPSQLTVVPEDARYPPRVSPLAVRAAEVAATPATPYVLSVSASTDVPVIAVRVSGPDLDKVRRLVREPVNLLSLRAAQAPSASRRLSVRTLTPATFEEGAAAGGRGLRLAALAALLLSGLWAAALVIVPGIARAWWRFGGRPSLDGT